MHQKNSIFMLILNIKFSSVFVIESYKPEKICLIFKFVIIFIIY